jgi:hypothetical protein
VNREREREWERGNGEGKENRTIRCCDRGGAGDETDPFARILTGLLET